MKSIRLILVLSALIALNSVALAQNVTELITVPNRHLEIYPDTFTGNHYLYGYFSQNYVASLQKRNANFDLDWELSSGKRTISDMGG